MSRQVSRTPSQNAFAEACRKYAFNVAFARLCSHGTPLEVARDRAEEAAQEAYLRLHARGGRARYSSDAHYKNAMARAAVNWLISYVRKRAPGALGEHDPCDPISLFDRADTDNDCTLELLRAALADLPSADRDLIRLKYEKNLTLQQIARRQSSTLNKVWYRLNTIRDQLRRKIEGHL
ncbi:MAG: sigma-70 family RNA polymerase sigma factor [Planctomycetes bacterium]|nr:sigma-70 family RNA polymerase sigma factor [Planctomycetota bacterium]